MLANEIYYVYMMEEPVHLTPLGRFKRATVYIWL